MKSMSETWLNDRGRTSSNFKEALVNTNFISSLKTYFKITCSNYGNLTWNIPTGTKIRILTSAVNRNPFHRLSVSTDRWMYFITQQVRRSQ